MEAAAEKYLVKREEINRKFCISEQTKELTAQRQKAYEDKSEEDINILRKKIRKAVWKDRQDFRLQNFEEELWFDIKQAKASYLPKHTKLREKKRGDR